MDVKKEKKREKYSESECVICIFFMDVISFHDKICKE